MGAYIKKVVVFGCIGMDGSYMAELLSSKGYEVHGVARVNTNPERIKWIKSLVPSIEIYPANITEKHEIFRLIKIIKPSEVYNFAGSTNVFDAWENLDLVFNLNARVPQYIMESILTIDKSIKFFQASSCLVFGRDSSGFQNEHTAINPIHPYGIAKASADSLLREFRSVFNVYFCSAIFFNHESERRGSNFFSKKTATAVANIKMGKQEKIKVGNLDSVRDLGYAPDYMKAVYLMMNNSVAKDYVVGTGSLTSMRDFTKKCFEYAGLDYSKHVEMDKSLYRENDTCILRADIKSIQSELGWYPEKSIDGIVKAMMEDAIAGAKNNTQFIQA